MFRKQITTNYLLLLPVCVLTPTDIDWHRDRGENSLTDPEMGMCVFFAS